MKKFLSLLLCAVFLLGLAGCGAKGDWQEKYDQGMRYLDEGNYAQARLAMLSALNLDPTRPEIYSILADIYSRMGDYDNMIAILQQGLAATDDTGLSQTLQQAIENGTIVSQTENSNTASGEAAGSEAPAENADSIPAENTASPAEPPATPDDFQLSGKDAELYDEAVSGVAFDFIPHFDQTTYLQVDSSVMDALQPLIDAALSENRDAVLAEVSSEATWQPLFAAARTALGDMGNNGSFWFSWEGTLFRVSYHIDDMYRSKDVCSVICLEYREQNGTAFRVGYEKMASVQQYIFDFGIGSTAEWAISGPMQFTCDNIIPEFPDLNMHGEGTDPAIFL